MRQLIKVGKEHIAQGRRCDAILCPVALAIYEQTGINIRVTHSKFYQYHFTTSYKVPQSVSRFVRKFDDKGKNHVKPFNFYLPNME